MVNHTHQKATFQGNWRWFTAGQTDTSPIRSRHWRELKTLAPTTEKSTSDPQLTSEEWYTTPSLQHHSPRDKTKRQTPIWWPLFHDNLGRPVKPIWILMKQEMMGWQWHQLDHMQIICTLLQTDNHASTSSSQAGMLFLMVVCSSSLLDQVEYQLTQVHQYSGLEYQPTQVHQYSGVQYQLTQVHQYSGLEYQPTLVHQYSGLEYQLTLVH